jgi:hypothetical protein
MATDRSANLAVPAAAALLLWPALWNGFPIVFADTGTYLSQAIHHYAGWDRPVFYSLFMLPLHATVTVWPVVAGQALLAAWVLRVVCRMLVPGLPGFAFVAGVAALSAASWLPWLVSELMPDLFTPLLVLALCLLAWVPERLAGWERALLVVLAAFMIASQQSSLPLACALLAVLGWARTNIREGCEDDGAITATRRPRPVNAEWEALPFLPWPGWVHRHRKKRPEVECCAGPQRPDRGVTNANVSWPGLARPPGAFFASTSQVVGGRAKPGHDTNEHDANDIGYDGDDEGMGHAPSPRRRWGLLILPPALAVLALCTVNLVAHGRFAISPFGNVFLLARVIYDGPGMTVLRRDCAVAHWRLCPFIDIFPPGSDDFLWTPDSPLTLAGGPKAVSQDAGAIIQAALTANPAGEARAVLGNTLEQLSRFASGDGLSPWPAQVSRWIEQDFPAREAAAYASARQQQGSLSVPPLLGRIHRIAALGGVVACVLILPIAFVRRARCAGFLLAALLAIPVSAAITGGLSAPHDRYQSRIMWLPPFIAVVSLASLRRRTA